MGRASRGSGCGRSSGAEVAERGPGRLEAGQVGKRQLHGRGRLGGFHGVRRGQPVGAELGTDGVVVAPDTGRGVVVRLQDGALSSAPLQGRSHDPGAQEQHRQERRKGAPQGSRRDDGRISDDRMGPKTLKSNESYIHAPSPKGCRGGGSGAARLDRWRLVATVGIFLSACRRARLLSQHM